MTSGHRSRRQWADAPDAGRPYPVHPYRRHAPPTRHHRLTHRRRLTHHRQLTRHRRLTRHRWPTGRHTWTDRRCHRPQCHHNADRAAGTAAAPNRRRNQRGSADNPEIRCAAVRAPAATPPGTDSGHRDKPSGRIPPPDRPSHETLSRKERPENAPELQGSPTPAHRSR